MKEENFRTLNNFHSGEIFQDKISFDDEAPN